MIVLLRKHPDRGPYVEIGFRRFCSSGWAVGLDFAARLLAGLEVALAAALREAGRGKCLRCGQEQDVFVEVFAEPVFMGIRCREPVPGTDSAEFCDGILAPVGEGE